MGTEIDYTPTERFWLWTLCVVSFAVVNGAFLYGAFVRPDAMAEALANPVSAAFMAEAGLLVVVFAYLLGRWGVSRLSWAWFVVLSFVGSIGFALPIVLLWGRKGGGGHAEAPGPADA